MTKEKERKRKKRNTSQFITWIAWHPRNKIYVWIHNVVPSLSKSKSSFIKNVPQISAKPISFQWNLVRKLPRSRPFFTNCFPVKLASKIPMKFLWNWPFFHKFVPENPAKLYFFPLPTKSPELLDTDRSGKKLFCKLLLQVVTCQHTITSLVSFFKCQFHHLQSWTWQRFLDKIKDLIRFQPTVQIHGFQRSFRPGLNIAVYMHQI